jgi:hypothetical protein
MIGVAGRESWGKVMVLFDAASWEKLWKDNGLGLILQVGNWRRMVDDNTFGGEKLWMDNGLWLILHVDRAGDG